MQVLLEHFLDELGCNFSQLLQQLNTTSAKGKRRRLHDHTAEYVYSRAV